MRGALDQGCGCFPTGGPWPGLVSDSSAAIAGLIAGLDPRGEWGSMALAAVDVETTGLDANADRVVELGIVLIDGGEISGRRSWLLNPGTQVPKEALAVHGLTDADLAGAPRFAEILPEVRATLEGRLPVAYNAPFDRGFLAAEILRLGEELPGTFRETTEWIDPLVWARARLPRDGSFKLSELTKRLGIELTNAHRALADAEAAARVLLRLQPELPPSYIRLVRAQRDLAASQSSDQASWRYGSRK
ncbi:MAG: 3'-5' exonuclease [Deltaproteobacteria bacterium]|nr:3'-5' exonuclease [Deltaproteobacteria bacterium]